MTPRKGTKTKQAANRCLLEGVFILQGTGGVLVLDLAIPQIFGSGVLVFAAVLIFGHA